MVSGGSKLQAICDFFTRSFSRFELERVLKFNGYEEAANSVAWDAPIAKSSLRMLEALDRRGLVNAEFFRRLGDERPARKAELEALQGAWLGDLDGPPTAGLGRLDQVPD